MGWVGQRGDGCRSVGGKGGLHVATIGALGGFLSVSFLPRLIFPKLQRSAFGWREGCLRIGARTAAGFGGRGAAKQ